MMRDLIGKAMGALRQLCKALVEVLISTTRAAGMILVTAI
jgi:hypothetical protein